MSPVAGVIALSEATRVESWPTTLPVILAFTPHLARRRQNAAWNCPVFGLYFQPPVKTDGGVILRQGKVVQNIPDLLTALKNSSRWSWLNVYVRTYFCSCRRAGRILMRESVDHPFGDCSVSGRKSFEL